MRQIGRCGQLTEPLPPSDRFSLLGERLQQEVR
ncbi:MAG: hydrogenase, partial [Zetaproteobacteria bacterium]